MRAISVASASASVCMCASLVILSTRDFQTDPLPIHWISIINHDPQCYINTPFYQLHAYSTNTQGTFPSTGLAQFAPHFDPPPGGYTEYGLYPPGYGPSDELPYLNLTAITRISSFMTPLVPPVSPRAFAKEPAPQPADHGRRNLRRRQTVAQMACLIEFDKSAQLAISFPKQRGNGAATDRGALRILGTNLCPKNLSPSWQAWHPWRYSPG
jgi:hypothetical protein